MVLQAFVDDSTADGEVLILAGFIASADNWARFSDEWQELLTIRPAWPRFKMSEAVASGGSESQERIRHHYKTILKYVRNGFALAVPLKPVDVILSQLVMPNVLSSAYLFAWPWLIEAVFQSCDRLGITEPIDFIFDNQSQAAHLVAKQTEILGGMQMRYGKRMNNFPIFRNDEEFLPLQAADLFAWIMRKKFLDLGNIMGNTACYFPWGEPMTIPLTMRAQMLEQQLFDYATATVGKPYFTSDGRGAFTVIPVEALRLSKKPAS